MLGLKQCAVEVYSRGCYAQGLPIFKTGQLCLLKFGAPYFANLEMTMTTRIESIDRLRGLVILLMALDHTRDFFSGGGISPRDVHAPLLFMTRWITHLCAPTFIFLAGASIFLWQQNHSKKETSRFNLIRGLWLIFLEFSVVKLGWTFNVSLEFMVAQVIWAIGVSMVFMSMAIYLPMRWLAMLSVITIAGHNVLDSIDAGQFGDYKWLWVLLHEQAPLTLWANVQVFIAYPLIPWLAVMSLGYCVGGYFLQPATTRSRHFLFIGISLITLFALLRYSNIYGDPKPWLTQDTRLATLLSFINCEKYPPSLLYLLMTLGVGSLLLVVMENLQGKLSELLLTFGRVPLLFYVIHLPLLHLFAIALAAINGENLAWLFKDAFDSKPAGYGYGLGMVYMVWLVAVACLYPVCRNYWRLKSKYSGLFRYL